jgi:hypothetical protein
MIGIFILYGKLLCSRKGLKFEHRRDDKSHRTKKKGSRPKVLSKHWKFSPLSSAPQRRECRSPLRPCQWPLSPDALWMFMLDSNLSTGLQFTNLSPFSNPFHSQRLPYRRDCWRFALHSKYLLSRVGYEKRLH